MTTNIGRNAMKKSKPKTQIVFNVGDAENITVETSWGDNIDPALVGKVLGLISRGAYNESLVESVYKYGELTGSEDIAHEILDEAMDTARIIDNYKKKESNKRARKNFEILWVPVEREDEPDVDEYAEREEMMNHIRMIQNDGPGIKFPKKDMYWGFTTFDVEPYFNEIMQVDGVEYGHLLGCYTFMLIFGKAFETDEVRAKIDRVICGKK